jgi:hypothetical protein
MKWLLPLVYPVLFQALRQLFYISPERLQHLFGFIFTVPISIE